MLVTDYFDDLELAACRRINALSRRWGVKALFSAISRLGDYPAWVGLGLVCTLQQGANAPAFVAQTLLTAAAGILVYKLLKQRLLRERPYITHCGKITCDTAPLDRYSFPSGHTLHAVSFAVLYDSHEPLMLLILVPFALLVAASRVILGLHYPSDVLAGAGIGGLIAASSVLLTV